MRLNPEADRVPTSWKATVGNRQGKVAGDSGGVREHGMVGEGTSRNLGGPPRSLQRAEYADRKGHDCFLQVSFPCDCRLVLQHRPRES
jgi:hypothetical protein